MSAEQQYVDSHGQSEVAFAFCRMLGFDLLPRLKNIHSQRLYRPAPSATYSSIAPVLTRVIDWDLIAQQYDLMVQYATALRLGTAQTEDILRRFARSNVQHPVYRALAELGKAQKTIFLCRYLGSLELRREINDGLTSSKTGTAPTISSSSAKGARWTRTEQTTRRSVCFRFICCRSPSSTSTPS
jgi:TnpA family transposase